MVFILKSHKECHDVEKKRQSSFRRKESNGDRLNKKRTINQFYVTSLNNCPEGTIIVTLLTKKRMKVIDHKINGIRSWRRSFVSFLYCFGFWRWICYKVSKELKKQAMFQKRPNFNKTNMPITLLSILPVSQTIEGRILFYDAGDILYSQK